MQEFLLKKGYPQLWSHPLLQQLLQKKGWFGKILKNGFSGTSNIGYYGNINGSCAGSTANQVTDYVKIKGECRSKDAEFASIITNEYNKAFNDSANLLKNIDNETAKIKFKKTQIITLF